MYAFLSLPESVYFGYLGCLSGTVVRLGTRSLSGLVFLTEGKERIHNELSVLFSFIRFGFGAGLLRMTYVAVHALLL